MKQFTATANDEGVRLSRFVQSVTTGLPASLLYKSFRNKRIKVNGRRAAPDTRLAAGDRIELYINDEFFPPEAAPARPARCRRSRCGAPRSGCPAEGADRPPSARRARPPRHPLLIKAGSFHDNRSQRACIANELDFGDVDISRLHCLFSDTV